MSKFDMWEIWAFLIKPPLWVVLVFAASWILCMTIITAQCSGGGHGFWWISAYTCFEVAPK